MINATLDNGLYTIENSTTNQCIIQTNGTKEIDLYVRVSSEDTWVKYTTIKEGNKITALNVVPGLPISLLSEEVFTFSIFGEEVSTKVSKSELDSKQDVILDLETIREGAAKGATALLSFTEIDPEWNSAKDNYYTKAEVDKIFNELRDNTEETDPVFSSSIASTITQENIDQWNSSITPYDDTNVKELISSKLDKLTSELIANLNTDHSKYITDISGKLDIISDLEAIREGASKGATALQTHQEIKTINGNSIIGSGDLVITNGVTDYNDLVNTPTSRIITLEETVVDLQNLINELKKLIGSYHSVATYNSGELTLDTTQTGNIAISDGDAVISDLEVDSDTNGNVIIK